MFSTFSFIEKEPQVRVFRSKMSLLKHFDEVHKTSLSLHISELGKEKGTIKLILVGDGKPGLVFHEPRTTDMIEAAVEKILTTKEPLALPEDDLFEWLPQQKFSKSEIRQERFRKGHRYKPRKAHARPRYERHAKLPRGKHSKNHR